MQQHGGTTSISSAAIAANTTIASTETTVTPNAAPGLLCFLNPVQQAAISFAKFASLQMNLPGKLNPLRCSYYLQTVESNKT
jgi:hypothetical protein